MPSTLIVGEVIHTNDLSSYNFTKGGLSKYNALFGFRAVFGDGGGPDPGYSEDTLDYINIGVLSDAVDFGDPSQARTHVASVADGVRGVWAGGRTPTFVDTIDYANILTTGDSKDFHELTQARRSPAGAADGSRGLFSGGDTPPWSDRVDYITIGTLGACTEFGGEASYAAAFKTGHSNGNRAIFTGGYSGSYSNVIEYHDIQHQTGATDIGDLTVARNAGAGLYDGNRGVVYGGDGPTDNNIDYFNMGHTGNAVDFGITPGNHNNRSTTGGVNGSRGVAAGSDSSPYDLMEYVNVGTTSNGMDFAELTKGKGNPSAVSGG